jgi:competence protein ComEA
MKPWQHILFGILLGVLLSAVIYYVAVPPKGTPVMLLSAPTPLPLVVDISGAVKTPGVYTLPRDSRLKDAIAIAGGVSDTADLVNINLAQVIRDGDKIRIPEEGDHKITVPTETAHPVASQPVLYPININTASITELDALPGIGPARASDIISYRDANGPFQSIEEIQKVPGIGPGIFEQLKSLITIDH